MLYYDRKDEDLVMLTLAGEQRAYEELVSRYEKRVLSAARSIAPTGGLAEDAAQDAFVTAWMKLNMLREPEKFGAWVCRIAKNCARNTVVRFREYLTLDVLENAFSENSDVSDPESILVSSEERMLLQDSVNALPERVRQIIKMHYFEGLSVLEIAERMSISEGTVKWQLHDGRKRIRKELTAMNEQIDDTLVQRVMKKVEELKAWQVQNDKSGFEKVYKNVLAEVEQLPECTDKYHALADVLMRGWWWIPGESNDALFDRIREAAETGKNDEVMAFVVSKEDQKLWGDARMEFVQGKQIPRLEAGGFKKALAKEYDYLGWLYCEKKDYEKGLSYFEKVLGLLPPSDCGYARSLAAIKMEAKCRDNFADISTNSYRFRAIGNEIRIMDNTLRFYKDDWYGEGYLTSADTDADFIFRNASFCDGYFTVNGAKLGDKTVGSDGTVLTFVSDDICVETPCGVFENCSLWVTERCDAVYNTYYKEGIGIVKQEKLCDDMVETRLLKEYKVLGGKGFLPFAKGNKWVYTANFDTEVLYHECEYTVCSADNIITLSGVTGIRRYKYDENSWLDMIQQIRTEYWVEENGADKICDVSYPISRAEILAKTPMEKAHTKAACAVARRIMDTDATFNPNRTADGHWNFFSKNIISRVLGKTVMNSHYRWSFEWKRDPSEPVLNNDIYGILQDGADCLWNDDWVDGATVVHKHLLWGSYPVKTVALCENAGEISVKAGTFENCFKVSLDIEGMKDGLAYRGGKKDYYFAPGVGIIKTVNHYCDGARQAVYELVSYEGTGDGYMPLSDGMVRCYEAIGLTDGDVAGANYYFVKDKSGNTVMFTDRTGIRKRLDNITDYSSIYSETLEELLWDAGKHEECRLRHDLNNFLLLIHFFGRPGYYWSMPEKAVAWNKYRLTVMDNLNGDGQVPKAFWGHYASTCFRTGCALCGYGKEEEGYEYLEKAIEYFVRWDAIPEGEALDVGDPLIYGGVKVLKGKKSILLPDGTLEPLTRPHLFRDTIGLMNYGMTAPHGWEWFDGVRNQDRFKQILEKVLEITNNK